MRHAMLALVAGLLLAGPAAAYRAENGMRVFPGAVDGTFVVDWSGLSGAPEFWCAAGDFVITGQGMPTGTHIYRYSPPPRRSGESITFGFEPGLAQPTGLLRVQGDRSLTAAYARNFCYRDRIGNR